jgi:hypothetical protein
MIVTPVLLFPTRFSHAGMVCAGYYLPDGDRTEEENETYDIFLG